MEEHTPVITFVKFAKKIFAKHRLKSAAHESYLLSKNSLVTIGISKCVGRRFLLKSYCSRLPGKNGMREQKLLKRRRTLGERTCLNVVNVCKCDVCKKHFMSKNCLLKHKNMH